jgi:CubicO group peptidase (beta-lactamase class C family)
MESKDNGRSLGPTRRETLYGLAGAATAGSVLAGACATAAPPAGGLIRNQDNQAAEKHGFKADGLDRIVAVFQEMLEEGAHPGAQLAIYRGGDLVLELAGGRDRPGGWSVSTSTLYQIRSTTKTLTTMVMMQAYERGRFKFDDPVAKHWPEFATNGKEAITIAQVLSHQAGIPDGPAIPYPQLGNRGAITKAIEAMTPVWPPGTQNGYHAHTIGWVSNELLLRWEGMGVSELLVRDIMKPLGVGDLYIGLPAAEYPRMAKMVVEPGVRERQASRAAFSDFLNSQEGIRIPMPSVSGVANARTLGRIMCIPALLGEVDGRRYYAAETQAIVTKPTNPPGRVDLRLQTKTRWGLGFILGDTPDMFGSTERPTLIGHAGGGANVIWGDPKTQLAAAFLCNRMLSGPESNVRYRRLGDAIHAGFA